MSRSRCMGVMGCHGPSWWRVRYCGKYCQGANCRCCSSHLCQVDSSTFAVLGGGLPWSVGACVVRQWNGCPHHLFTIPAGQVAIPVSIPLHAGHGQYRGFAQRCRSLLIRTKLVWMRLSTLMCRLLSWLILVFPTLRGGNSCALNALVLVALILAVLHPGTFWFVQDSITLYDLPWGVLMDYVGCCLPSDVLPPHPWA